MDEKVIVRPIVQKDFTAWKVLWDGYNAFYGRAGETALSSEITELTWARFLNVHEPMHALVATRSGAVIGLAHYIFHRSTTQLGLTCYLQDLFTAEAARGKGVGRALINAVCAEAKAGGSSRVYWHTHETNALAMLLYDTLAEKSGFVVYRKALQS